MDDVFASLRADNASSFSFVDLEDNDLVLVEPAIEKRVEGEEAMFPESFDGNLNVSMDGSCSQTSLHPQDLLVSDEEMDLLSEHEADMEESPPQLSQRIDHVDSQDSTQCIHTESPEHGSYLGSDSSEELDQRTWIMSQLQDFVLSFLRQLADCVEGKRSGIVLELADRKKQRDDEGNYQARKLVFPKSTLNGSSLRGIATLIGVIDYVFEALVINIPATKRDIYYRDVALFKKQVVVDNLVDDIGATLSVERGDILVRASSKGLFCGSALSLRLQNGTVISGSDNQPAIIPNGDDIEEMIIDEDISFTLVVEKEAIFQTLAQVGFARNNVFKRPGIIITGKGYGDVSTRQLVHKLSAGLPERIPILGLVDPDPFGVDILACYAFGSEALHHQRETLVAERITLLGVKFSELEELGISRASLLPITEKDEKKIQALLARPEEMMPKEWRDELENMSDQRAKAEIEVLCSRPMGSDGKLPLVAYLENKMQRYL